MVILRVSGGLGNQLFQYAKGRAVALQNNAPLVLDVSWFKQKHPYTPRKFQLHNFNVEAFITPNILVKILENNLAREIDRLIGKPFFYHPTVNDPIWTHQKASIFKSPIILDGFWSDFSHFGNYWGYMFHEFEMASNFRNVEYSKLFQLINTTNSISVHIRRGDYLEDKESDFFGVQPNSYYEKSFEFLKDKVVDAKFFVFTDDERLDVKKMFQGIDAINVSRILKNDVLEFSLMSICKSNIMANSTFSWWAAFLNQNAEKIVLQPKVWYKNQLAQESYEKGMVLSFPGSFKI